MASFIIIIIITIIIVYLLILIIPTQPFIDLVKKQRSSTWLGRCVESHLCGLVHERQPVTSGDKANWVLIQLSVKYYKCTSCQPYQVSAQQGADTGHPYYELFFGSVSLFHLLNKYIVLSAHGLMKSFLL